ncbi:MAG: hypothetical protein GF383_14970 [Candidatus Lokiarchaeota archaeon]|nr:hypothetical protein [Candidatus Lokiarchaeota archaeon]MBD3342777.1 hypothetical protein [Candidatus Lokiarchaeota archaeon]
MSKVIDDIWIIKKEGLVLFSIVNETKIAKELIGSMISALDCYADEFIKGNLTSIDMLTTRFFIKRFNDILLIATSSKKERKVNEALDKIGSRFLSLYSDTLNNWNHDTNEFIEFKEEIQDILENPINKFLVSL